MRAGELQRLAERERETESVHQAEGERDHPAALAQTLGSGDVLERHVDDRGGDGGFDERRKPERVGARSNADATSVIECATVKAVTTMTSGRSGGTG